MAVVPSLVCLLVYCLAQTYFFGLNLPPLLAIVTPAGGVVWGGTDVLGVSWELLEGVTAGLLCPPKGFCGV